MEATSFDEANHIIDKPAEMTRDECEPLNVWHGLIGNIPGMISCWKPTKEELEEITKTGRVWVYHYGNGLQPHAVSGTNPFKQGQ